MSDIKPDTPSAYFAAMRDYWRPVNALMGGTRAMRDAGNDYLPKHAAETDTEYAERLEVSTLMNVFRMTVRQMTGQAFANPVQVDDDGGNAAWIEDIDQRGTSLSQFARRAFSGALQKAECYILADKDPRGEGERNRRDSARAGRRPRLVLIRPEQMLAFQTEVVGGAEVVTLARWETKTWEPDPKNEFGEVVVTRVKEYRRDGYRIWRREQKAENGKAASAGQTQWTLETEGDNAFKFEGQAIVPMVRIALVEAEDNGTRVPPLMDLADKNIEHWQSASDQRAILTFSRFAMLFLAGVSEDDVPKNDRGETALGPKRAITAADPQAKGSYIEPGGAAIQAGERDLARLIEEMATLAAQPYITRPGDVTATRTALEDGKASSVIEHWLEIMRDGLKRALQYMAAWDGKSWSPTLTIEPDFGAMVNNADRARSLIAARQNGDLSRGEFLRQMRDLEYVSDSFDAEANEAGLAIENGTSLEGEPGGLSSGAA